MLRKDSPSSLSATAFCSCLALEAAWSLSASISASCWLRVLVWILSSSCSPNREVRGRTSAQTNTAPLFLGPSLPTRPSSASPAPAGRSAALAESLGGHHAQLLGPSLEVPGRQ